MQEGWAHGPALAGRPAGSADRLDDLGRELGELLEALDALGLEPLDHVAVLVPPPLALVEPARLQQLDVVEVRDAVGDQVAEVVVLGPR